MTEGKGRKEDMRGKVTDDVKVVAIKSGGHWIVYERLDKGHNIFSSGVVARRDDEFERFPTKVLERYSDEYAEVKA